MVDVVLPIIVVVFSSFGPLLMIGGLVALWSSRPREGDNAAKVRNRGPARVVGLLFTIVGGVVSWGVTSFFYDIFYHPQAKGRALRLRGRARVAARTLGPASDWSDTDVTPSLDGLSGWQRTVLGEAWLRTAQLEHASVPAFSRLALALAAVGAPAELLERTHHAALDEIDHARRCYALARAYSGKEWSAGELPALATSDEPRLRPRTDDALARLAIGSLVDGCLGEGVAAAVARRSAELACDPVVRCTLETIAKDELSHAELAWDVLSWTLARDAQRVTPALREALRTLPDRRASSLPPIPGVSPEWLVRQGLLLDEELGAITEREIASVIGRAQQLFDAPAACAA